jgi:hypothetical protein
MFNFRALRHERYNFLRTRVLNLKLFPENNGASLFTFAQAFQGLQFCPPLLL